MKTPAFCSIWTVALVGLTVLVLACRHAPPQGEYYCPMHPDYVSDKPGDCPICNMRLVKKDRKSAPETGKAEAPSGRRVLFYRHPMNPSITSPVPAKDEMGMDYVPVYSDEVGASAAGGPKGMARFEVGEQGRRLAGVQTAVAERQTLTSTTRAVGVVVADETRVRTVQTKVSGWVEKLYVNSTGQPVRAGQPLLALYSPQLLATQEEFLRARQTAERFAQSALPEVRRGGEDLLAASRRRLELFDVPRGTIAQLERTGKSQRTVTLTAPASGYVTAKEVFEGQEVQPGMTLFTVTDLSRIWVEADFYQMDSRALAVARPALITLPNDPGVRLSGRVTLVYPMLDPQSRTLKARIELANAGLLLKPGMYVDVTPDLATQTGVVVPDSAVLDTGVRQMVFVETGETFEPREVRVGSRGDGKALILQGVEAGERVAVAANFLLDSESRLRSAVAGMKPGGGQ